MHLTHSCDDERAYRVFVLQIRHNFAWDDSSSRPKRMHQWNVWRFTHFLMKVAIQLIPFSLWCNRLHDNNPLCTWINITYYYYGRWFSLLFRWHILILKVIKDRFLSSFCLMKNLFRFFFNQTISLIWFFFCFFFSNEGMKNLTFS